MDKMQKLLIEHLMDKPQSEKRDIILAAAKTGEYGYFTSSLAMPKTALYYHLHEAGFPDLATNVTRGLYDY